MSGNPVRSAAGGMLELGSRLLDDAIPNEPLQQFIKETLAYLAEEYRKDPSIWPDRMCAELNQSLSNAVELGWEIQEEVRSERSWIDFLPAYEIALHRFQEISKQGLLQDGFIRPDTGEVLTAMVLRKTNAVAPEIASYMERLLRHVEVRRTNSLPIHTGHADPDRNLLRHDVALCFVVAARGWDDARFLNAALKLNDWAFHSSRRSSTPPSLSRYLLALTECELAIREVAQR